MDASDKRVCNWRLKAYVAHREEQAFETECRGSSFVSMLPVNSMSYCPYCGGWLAVHSKPDKD